MRKIRVPMFVSLDGVLQGPGGPNEDPTGGFRFSGWTVPFSDEESGELTGQAMGEDYDLLLGRRTYEIFSAYWPYQDDEIGRTFDRINKYVVAGADTEMTWKGSERLEGDAVEAVRALKASEGRDLLIHGSSELVQTLLAADLIDTLTLLTYPVILGKGKRLFDDGAAPHTWTMTHSAITKKGVVVATYQRAGEVETGTFETQPPSPAEHARRERWSRGEA